MQLDVTSRERARLVKFAGFFSRRVLTLGGIRQAFVLAFIHVQTRRVILSSATFKPDAAWVREYFAEMHSCAPPFSTTLNMLNVASV